MKILISDMARVTFREANRILVWSGMNELAAVQRSKRLVKQLLDRELWSRPQVRCATMVLGTRYRGYCICPDVITKEAVVYSAGIGEDVSFDLMMVEKFGTDVFAFDPTPRSVRWVCSQNMPERFHFFEYGIASFDGVAAFSPPSNPTFVSYRMKKKSESPDQIVEGMVYRLQSIMKMLGHERVDILKMDIEGAEYAVLEDITGSDVSVDQVLLEFHHSSLPADLDKTRKAIRRMNDSGYRIFYVSPSGREYSFIHERVLNQR